MRYFLQLSYLGTDYFGWQRQPKQISVQEKIESVLSYILNEKIEITGCGRTDTGVHAKDYVAHFDTEKKIPITFLKGANNKLPDDIVLHSLFPVHADAHARYDAFERSYEYRIGFQKDPFASKTVWHYQHQANLDFDKLQQTAALFPKFKEFFPFCKSGNGMDVYDCELKTALWEKEENTNQWIYKVTSNRFLRGMIRLQVGACLQVANGKLNIEEVENALIRQTLLPKSLSVPPQGLCLMNIKYPYSF
jgi:tRNA pseudouridine38-40 synthase